MYLRESITKLLSDAVNSEISNGFGVFYIDKNKTTAYLTKAGLQLPGVLRINDGLIHTITDTKSPVKMKILDATHSKQFKRWFGDWQKHPENASKVVNADGTPKVVYHGTNVKFTIFNSTSGLYWFSEYEDYAEEMAYERGGKNVMGVYLNMRNPYMASLPAN